MLTKRPQDLEVGDGVRVGHGAPLIVHFIEFKGGQIGYDLDLRDENGFHVTVRLGRDARIELTSVLVRGVGRLNVAAAMNLPHREESACLLPSAEVY